LNAQKFKIGNYVKANQNIYLYESDIVILSGTCGIITDADCIGVMFSNILNGREIIVADTELTASTEQEFISQYYQEFVKGRDVVINNDDILDLKIMLHTITDVADFLSKI
jgi:hypothetical protein